MLLLLALCGRLARASMFTEEGSPEEHGVHGHHSTSPFTVFDDHAAHMDDVSDEGPAS